MNTENKFEWDDKKIKELFEYIFPLTKPADPRNFQNWIDHFKKSKGFTPTVERDFEILSFVYQEIGTEYFTKDIDGRFRSPFHPHAFIERALLRSKFPIHSVRRLSDGEVFTVGDVTVTVGYVDYPNKPIKRFFIKEGVMYIQWDEGRGSNDGCMGLNAIEKVIPKKILGTTHDGKVCYEGDTFPLWGVNSMFDLWVLNVPSCSWDGRILYFAEKEKALQYINENKPIQVSYKEIEDIIQSFSDGTIGKGNKECLLNKVSELFNSKIQP